MDNDQGILIQQAIDGTNTPDEQARLDRLVSEDASVRIALDEMKGLAARLKSQPLMDPPADFSKRVMASLPVRPVQQPDVAAWWRSLVDLVIGRRFALVYAAVAGVVLITATVFTLSNPGAVDPATGTMGAGIEVTHQVQLPDVTGTIQGTHTSDRLVIRLALDASALSVVMVTYDADALSLIRMDPEDAPQALEPGIIEFQIADTAIRTFTFDVRGLNPPAPVVTIDGVVEWTVSR